MVSNALQNIEQLEASLWEAADQLRANSKLTSSEYCMPVLGVIFLRHATNRYNAAVRQIEADQANGKMAKRKLIQADFLKRRALMLPAEARYDQILKLPKGSHLGTALVDAMNAIESSFEPLLNQLPKDYDKFENDLLENILRIFDSEALRTATGDVFGRIYEYFLMKFAMQGAQDNGEFFTPPSIVQTIVNVIEPDHGVVADLACGSGGMFVQTSHFIERMGEDTTHRVTFFGQEKTGTTIRLALMNLAVHGLEGKIREANTFYEDVHRLEDEREPDSPYIGLEHIPRRSIALCEWGRAEEVTSTKHRFRAGDILFGKIRPYFHKVGVAFVEGVASSDAIVLRPAAAEWHSLALLTVSSDAFVADASKTAREGSKMPRADWKLMRTRPVHVPPETLLRAFNAQIEPIVAQLKTLTFQTQRLRTARDLLLPRLMSGEVAV
jgi:hypothetical protein